MPEVKRRWFRIRVRSLLLLILIAVVGMSVYSYWADYRREQLRRARELPYPAVGKACTVVFKGSALGVDSPPPPTAEVNGMSNSLSGEFRAINDQWIVLQRMPPDDSVVWIPREHVLLIRVPAQ